MLAFMPVDMSAEQVYHMPQFTDVLCGYCTQSCRNTFGSVELCGVGLTVHHVFSKARHCRATGGGFAAALPNGLRLTTSVQCRNADRNCFRLCRLNYQFQIYSYVTPGKDPPRSWTRQDQPLL